MSSLVCGLDVHKDNVYATVMNYDGEIIDKRKLTNDEVANCLNQYPIDKVAMESSTSIVPVYRALRGRGHEIFVSHPKKTRLIAESRIKTMYHQRSAIRREMIHFHLSFSVGDCLYNYARNQIRSAGGCVRRLVVYNLPCQCSDNNSSEISVRLESGRSY